MSERHIFQPLVAILTRNGLNSERYGLKLRVLAFTGSFFGTSINSLGIIVVSLPATAYLWGAFILIT
jgi:hypothetical protein